MDRSQYIQLCNLPGHVAEAMFLKDDGLRLRGVFQNKVSEAQISRNLQRHLDPGALTATLNWYRALDLDARVCPVDVPTLYIWGDQDMALGRVAVDATKHYVNAPYRLEVLAGHSHWLQDDASQAVSNLIKEHLNRQ